MSYSLYITRAESWLDSQETPIEKDEWLEIVKRDKLQRSDDYPGTYAVLEKGKEVGWLLWEKGRIESGWPNDPTFSKMLSVARRLKARIEGDEHEHYDSLKDWRLANDRDARIRKFKRMWAPFKKLADRQMRAAGFQEGKHSIWCRQHTGLPIRDVFYFYYHQDRDLPSVQVCWGFWYDFAPTKGPRSLKWGTDPYWGSLGYHVNALRDQNFPNKGRAYFRATDALTPGKSACEKKLRTAVASAEDLFQSVSSMQHLLDLYIEQKRTMGYCNHDFSWACVLIALGRISDGMRKLNHHMKCYRESYTEDDVVPKMIRKLGEHRGPLERAWERRSGTTQRRKKK